MYNFVRSVKSYCYDTTVFLKQCIHKTYTAQRLICLSYCILENFSWLLFPQQAIGFRFLMMKFSRWKIHDLKVHCSDLSIFKLKPQSNKYLLSQWCGYYWPPNINNHLHRDTMKIELYWQLDTQPFLKFWPHRTVSCQNF